MPKPPAPTSTPISLKGTKSADTIVIGEGAYANYTDAQQLRGFIIDGGNGDDVIAGGIGKDQIKGGAGFDIIVAQEEDILGAAAGTAAYDGGLDRDIVDFSAWTDAVGIDLGSNNISGDRDWYYTDFAMGTPTSLYTSGTYSGYLRGVTVSIEGVIGGSGNDYIGGDWGANYLEGGAGDDFLNGKYGQDRLVGGDGNDLLQTGIDNDIVTGGAGNDAFVFAGAVVGAYYVTTVTDFDTQADGADPLFDSIWINQGFDWDFDTAADGTLKIVYGSATDGLFGEILLQGLDFDDAATVVVRDIDPVTGMPI